MWFTRCFPLLILAGCLSAPGAPGAGERLTANGVKLPATACAATYKMY